jgi:glycosyltransferase involved in cell wall biosynthesis
MSADRPRKVLWVSCVGEVGGAEVYLLNLLRRLDRERFVPAVAVLRSGSLEKALRELEVEVHTLRPHRMRHALAVARAVGELSRLVAANGYELIHSNGFRAHVYGGLAARRAGVPEVWTVHTVERPGAITTAILRIPTTQVVANCRRTADYFVARHRPTSLIWPSIDAAALRERTGRADLTRRYGLPDQARWVCMGARLQRYKGHAFFLRALAALPAAFHDVHGVVMGGSLFGMEPDYPAELQALSERLGIQGRLRLTGFIPDADVHGFLAAGEMLVHPALDEDFGLIMAEAQALGKPVLAFNTVGANAIVLSGRTGEIVPVGDQAGLSAALARLLAQPGTLRAWGEAGRARAAACFAAESAARQLERVYAGCLPPPAP